MEGGLVAQTLNEQSDINPAKPLFEDAQGIKTDPEMVSLAVQLIDRQTDRYDAADLEDRYETRLRAMIEAKVKGEPVDETEGPTYSESNVVDLMAALRKSLGGPSGKEPPAVAPTPIARTATRKMKAPTQEEMRRQPALKLPIKGGGKKRPTAVKEAAPQAVEQTTLRLRRKA